jgi:hypothetical protein
MSTIANAHGVSSGIIETWCSDSDRANVRIVNSSTSDFDGSTQDERIVGQIVAIGGTQDDLAVAVAGYTSPCTPKCCGADHGAKLYPGCSRVGGRGECNCVG